jgi:simple sugar transport system ATP-binding protein
MGKELTGWSGFMRIKRQKEETLKLMKEMMGFTSSFVTPDTPVGNMSGGERQGVAICRALYFEADLIVLDEPTGGLSLSETRKVLKFVSSIKESGKSCIFITHNLFHVYPVADRIIVLDRGKIVDTFVKGQIKLEQLEARMLEIAGTSDIDLKVPVSSKAISKGTP